MTFTRGDLLVMFKKIQEEELELMGLKAKGYSESENAFFNFEEVARDMELPVEDVFLFFIVHKMKRLRKLKKEAMNPKEEKQIAESIEDTLKDLSNYANIWASYNRLNKKEKEEK